VKKDVKFEEGKKGEKIKQKEVIKETKECSGLPKSEVK